MTFLEDFKKRINDNILGLGDYDDYMKKAEDIIEKRMSTVIDFGQDTVCLALTSFIDNDGVTHETVVLGKVGE